MGQDNVIERPNFYVISGCSGGGKSTLLSALRRAGMVCVEESGRGIVRVQLRIGGPAVPGQDSDALGELILTQNLLNFDRHADETRPVFFDRGIPEAIGGDVLSDRAPRPHHLRAAAIHRYNRRVFIVPPWPEIFARDAERLHGLDEAIEEHGVQCRVYEDCGYELVEVPRLDVESRVRFVLDAIR